MYAEPVGFDELAAKTVHIGQRRTVTFRATHVDDENIRVTWRGLCRYLVTARE
jgi:hypothetical protein